MELFKWGRFLLFVNSLAFAGPTFRAVTQVPSELLQSIASAGLAISGTLQRSIQFNDLVFQDIAKKQIQSYLPGGRHLFVEGMPQVPVRTEAMRLPPGKKARVILDDLTVEETTTAVSLPLTPREQSWDLRHGLSFSAKSLGRYFPGKWHSTKEVNGVLYLSFFPIQWDRETGRAIALRKANVKVELMEEMREVIVPDRETTPAIILTSESMLPAAEKLKRFHAEAFQLSSSIMTVEEISRAVAPIDLSAYPKGYADSDLSSFVPAFDREKNTGYDFELARKVKAYFEKKTQTASQFKYLTILGDVEEVPPSYYFVVGETFSMNVGVTDLCYGAKNHCLEPAVAVGRLPFSTAAELDLYLSKVSKWLKLSIASSSELALYGGKAFPSNVYIGELGTLKTISSDRADWKGIEKFHRTRMTYTKSQVLDMTRGGKQSSFLYYLDHGHGNRWYVDKEYVSSKEILEANDSGSGINPVVVSIACINAAFDEELSKDNVLASQADGEESVGVSLLKSKAGAVAYLGSPRPAIGMPIYHFDKNGNLNLTGTTYGLQMLDTFFDKYRTERAGRLGDIVLKMYRAYLNENGNDMENESHVWTYFNVALLGDPALNLPTRTWGEKFYPTPTSTTDFGPLTKTVPEINLDAEKKVEITFSALVPLKATLLKLPTFDFGGKEEVLQTELVEGTGKFTAKFNVQEPQGKYFLRLENAQGVPFERQIWFSVNRPSVLGSVMSR